MGRLLYIAGHGAECAWSGWPRAQTVQARLPTRATISAEQFLARSSPKAETLTFAELGGDIVVKGLSLKERDSIMSGSTDTRTGKVTDNAFVSLTVLTGMVEPKLTPQNVAELSEKNFGLMNLISKAIWKLSGVEKDEDSLKNV